MFTGRGQQHIIAGKCTCAFMSTFIPNILHTPQTNNRRLIACPAQRRRSVIRLTAETPSGKGAQRAKKPARKQTSANQKVGASKPANTTEQTPTPTPPTKPRAGAQNVGETENLGETPQDPIYNSTLLTAMRDYFGDDGREMQDYMKRPRNAAGQLMFRVVIAGSSEADVKLAKQLSESNLMRGLYYCGHNEDRVFPPDEDEEEAEEEAGEEAEVAKEEISGMAQYANLANDGEPFSADGVVWFAKWCVADAVFVGAECDKEFDREVEPLLAEAGITLFANDVGRAISEGQLDILECLSALVSSEEIGEGETLIE